MRAAIVILFSFSQLFLFAQEATFRHVIGGPEEDEARAVIATSDGGFAIVGSSASFRNQNADLYLLKIDSLGQYQWSAVYGGDGLDWGYDLKQSSDGGYILAGYSNSFNSLNDYDGYMVKTDSLGNLEWQKTYGGSDWDYFYGLEICSDGSYLAVGSTFSFGNGNQDVYIVKTKANGDTLWTATWGKIYDDIAYDVSTLFNNDLIISGYSTDVDKDALLMTVDNNGAIIDTTVLSYKGDEILYKVVQKKDTTGMLAFGYTEMHIDSQGTDMMMVEVNNNLDSLKTLTINYSTSRNDKGYAVVDRGGGSYVVGGYIEISSTNKNMYMHVMGAGGTPWNTNNFGEVEEEIGYDLILSRTRSSYIQVGTTNSYGQGYNDILIVRTTVTAETTSNDFVIINDSLTNNVATTLGAKATSQDIVASYPNPALNKSYLEIPEPMLTEIIQINIYSMDGKLLEEILPPYSSPIEIVSHHENAIIYSVITPKLKTSGIISFIQD